MSANGGVCSGYDCVASVWILPQSTDMRLEWTDVSKLTLGVNVSMNGCLSVRINPAMSWRPGQDVPRLSPGGSWDKRQHPLDPVFENGWMDGWLDPLHSPLLLSAF